MDDSFFVLTTIGRGKVAILETTQQQNSKRGEYRLSTSCVAQNVESGKFVDVTEDAIGSEGKVYILAEDLTRK